MYTTQVRGCFFLIAFFAVKTQILQMFVGCQRAFASARIVRSIFQFSLASGLYKLTAVGNVLL